MSAADDGLDDPGSVDRLVERYRRYAREVRSPDRALRLIHEACADEASQASDQVDELVRTMGPGALPLLVRLALSAPDEDFLAFFAAGPLEGWMGHAREEDVARAAVEARREPRFREATKHVVLSEQRQRLWERLVGGSGVIEALG